MKVLGSMSHKLSQFLGRSNTVNTEKEMKRLNKDIEKYITEVKNKGVNVNEATQEKTEKLTIKIRDSFIKLSVFESKAREKSNNKDKDTDKHNNVIEKIENLKNKFNLVTGDLIDTSTNTQSSTPIKSSLNLSPTRSAAEIFMTNRKAEEDFRKAEEDFSTWASGRTTYAPHSRPSKGLIDTSTSTGTPLSLAPGSSLNVAEPRNGAEIFMARKAGDDFTAFTQERAPKMVEDDSTVLDKEILKAKEHILSFKKDLAAKKEKLEGLGNSVQDFLEETKLKEGIDNINRKIDDLEFFITNFKSGNASPRSVALTSPSNSAPDDTSLVLKPQPFSEKLMGGQSESNLAPPQKEKPPVPPKPDYLKRGAVSQSPMSDKQVTNFSSKFEFKPVAALPDPVATSYALEKLKESTEV
ncbi:hypothetical protein [Candidatus Regiella endosymbiont of Tuberolachnus salignus]|uniref:hypothetical protein n=1 Tax=Candidatus Regiella endosymbiont of Tuberolachnus salignus TaxID=3077956 RepID=UPI0030D36078